MNDKSLIAIGFRFLLPFVFVSLFGITTLSPACPFAYDRFHIFPSDPVLLMTDVTQQTAAFALEGSALRLHRDAGDAAAELSVSAGVEANMSRYETPEDRRDMARDRFMEPTACYPGISSMTEQCTLFFFYKNLVYKRHEAEIC